MGPLDVARGERVERDPHHLRGALTHLGQPLDEVVARLELGGELRQLRDRDALVADPLEVDRVVQDREHEPQVGGDRRLLGEQLPDRLLDPVVARVDLVVERDDLVAQLDVLRAEDVDGAAERAQDELRPAPEASPRAHRGCAWNSTRAIAYPNRPVT